MLTVTPLSLQALEFERTRLVNLYSSFAYSEMAEAIPLIDFQLTNRVSWLTLDPRGETNKPNEEEQWGVLVLIRERERT